MRRMLAPALLAMFLGAGCDRPDEPRASAEAADGPAATVSGDGELQLDEKNYPFTVTTCVRGDIEGGRELVLQGRGTTAAGEPFEVQADGLSGPGGLIEMRVRDAEGSLLDIYTLSLQPGALRADDHEIAAEGEFVRVSQGRPVGGRFQARCE
jgi:hypothetical protein